jgi:heptose I phosphotransferase
LNYGSFWQRLVRGVGWSWVDPGFQPVLPPDLDASVMTLDSQDRLHAKQGRSTARVVFHAGEGGRDSRPLAVYLKRHYRLPWRSGLAALVDPAGRHSPGAAEWAHLERARALGVPVPRVVASGERIGPWTSLQSYLLVEELAGCEELNVCLPALAGELRADAFAALKRRLAAEMARVTALLHRACVFHKDFYLCHFFLDRTRLRGDPEDVRLVLIDFHRLGEHQLWPDRWRWKDLGQLLFSTHGVAGIEDRDLLRFWKHYSRQLGLRNPRWQAQMVRLKAARYLLHNRPPARGGERSGTLERPTPVDGQGFAPVGAGRSANSLG